MTEKITVSELLRQRGWSWWRLYSRSQGSISKSMAFDWARGAHQPNRQSAFKIARVLGVSADTIKTRERQDNRPKEIVHCLTCGRRLWKLPSNSVPSERCQTT
jgi:hypothetical protein